jgi:four helix bundle protein
MTNLEMQNRLIDFSLSIIELSKLLNQNVESNYLTGQIVRSGTSPALNYAEALGSASRKDFTHKLTIVAKELRETFIALKIIDKRNLCSKDGLITNLLKENNELIAIITKSILTLKSNP